MMRPVLLLAMLNCCGCLLQPNYSHDNPTTRTQQEETLKGLENEISGQSLDSYLGPRTGWILPSDSALLSERNAEVQGVDLGGRAAAVSADGYYLTAFHVVDGSEPVMVLPQNTPCESGRKSSLAGQECMLSIGRVVEHFQPHDVALVKFGHRPAAYFKSARSRIEKSATVFVAATDGYVVGKERIGNGPFKARGKVIVVSGERNARIVSTSIPVRGGMSGAPCADSNGELVGILTGGRMSHVRHRTLSSNFVSVPIETVLSAVEADRQSSEERTP